MRLFFLFFSTIVMAATLVKRQNFIDEITKAVTKGFGPLAGPLAGAGAKPAAAANAAAPATPPPEQTASVKIPELTAVVSLPGPATTLQAGQVRPDEAVVAVAGAGNTAQKTAVTTAPGNGPRTAGVAKPSDQLTKIVPSV